MVRHLGVEQDRGQDGGQHRGELISLTRGTRDNIKRKMIVDISTSQGTELWAESRADPGQTRPAEGGDRRGGSQVQE